MARLLEELERPYGREHYELIRAGREGIYRQAADGLIIRIAAAEGGARGRARRARVARARVPVCVRGE